MHWGPEKGPLFGWFIGGQMVLQWRPHMASGPQKGILLWRFIRGQIIYNCMVYMSDGFSDISWPPNGLKPQNCQNFANFLQFFCIFNFTNRLHLASGPHKGILLGGPLVTRWSSSLGHGLSPNKHLHDLPFWASHFMYIAITFVTYHGLQNWKLSCFGPYNCKNCTWFERLKKVHHVRVPIGGPTGLQWTPCVIYWWS